jgi:hypothetical protein
VWNWKTDEEDLGGAGSLHTKTGNQLVDEPDFPYSYWYVWEDKHLDYMKARAGDHASKFFSYAIGTFKWARNNIEYPGCESSCLGLLPPGLTWSCEEMT